MKKEFEMHVKMVQAFVNFRLAVLLMNKKDGGERIKHTAIKKRGKKYNREPQKHNRQKLLYVLWSSKEVQDGTWMGNLNENARVLTNHNNQPKRTSKQI